MFFMPLPAVTALCPDCKGARLRKEALYVRVGGKNSWRKWFA